MSADVESPDDFLFIFAAEKLGRVGMVTFNFGAATFYTVMVSAPFDKEGAEGTGRFSNGFASSAKEISGSKMSIAVIVRSIFFMFLFTISRGPFVNRKRSHCRFL